MQIVVILNAPILGGAELVAVNQAIEFRRLGYKVQIISVSPKSDQEAVAMLKENGVETVFLNGRTDKSIYSWSSLWIAAHRLSRIFETFESRVIVSFSHGEFPDLLVSMARPLRIGSLKKLKYIRTSHNERYFGARFGWVLERIINLCFDRVIAISERTLRHNGKKATLIYNPVAIEGAQNKGFVGERASNGSPVFGVFGRLSKQKQQRLILDWLVSNAPKDSGFSLDLWGFEPEPGLDQLILESGVRVVQRGRYRRSQPVFSYVDVVLIPSAFEGLSTVMVEALEAGVPVVSFDVSGVSDLAWHSDLFVVDSVEEMLQVALKIRPARLTSDRRKLVNMFDPRRHAAAVVKKGLIRGLEDYEANK